MTVSSQSDGATLRPLARPTMCFIGLGRASLEMYVVRSPGFLDMLLKESPALATEAMTQLFPDLDIVLVDVQEPLISRSGVSSAAVSQD